tara:strand:+ start:9157 stop:9585 length:429 start_codon:yes stop_codon:yes gene_type:complete
MSIRFENKKDLDREKKAVQFFCDLYNFTFKKLGENDIDFAIYKNDKIICFLEVKGRNRYLKDCYPLPVAIRKLLKLSDKRINPVMLWACYDGIVYCKTKLLEGIIKTGGRKKRKGSTNDIEIMAYYEKNKNLIEAKYEMQKL